MAAQVIEYPKKETAPTGGNETWEIEITSPLVRPGVTLRTSVSYKYLVPALRRGLDAIRNFNGT